MSEQPDAEAWRRSLADDGRALDGAERWLPVEDWSGWSPAGVVSSTDEVAPPR